MNKIKIAVLLALYAVILSAAHARDIKGEFRDLSEPQQRWVTGLHAPGQSIPCCDISDGTKAQEEPHHEGQMTEYRASFEACQDAYNTESARWEPINCEMVTMDIPDEVVIREGNRIGRTVVWYVYEAASESKVVHLRIRCFLPADGV